MSVGSSHKILPAAAVVAALVGLSIMAAPAADAATVSVPAAFNNVGISASASPSSTGIDGEGNSFSQESLDASGLTPGATVSSQGVTFTMPDVAAGTKDNIELAGQTVAVSGSGATLGFLGMADFGQHTAAGTITYTDGTTEPFTLTFPDWFTHSAAAVLADRIVAGGTVAGKSKGTVVSMYSAIVPLHVGKTISSVTLPSNSDMHVFAIGIGQALASVPAAFNNVGISDDASPTTASIDGEGNSFSQESLNASGLTPGAAVSSQGVTFAMPDVAAGQADNIEADGQTVAFTGQSATLGFLGMADFGQHSGTGTITYSDGSTQAFTLTFPDWFTHSAAAVAADRIVAGATVNGKSSGTKVSMYSAVVPAQANKTITSVTLPDDGDMHIFAIGTGPSPPAPAPAPTTATPAPPPTSQATVSIKPKRHMRRVDATVKLRWRWNKDRSWLRAIHFRHLPKHSTIRVSCNGKRCPWQAIAANQHERPKLITALKKTTFHGGEKLTIKISARKLRAERVRIDIRNGRKPTGALLA